MASSSSGNPVDTTPVTAGSSASAIDMTQHSHSVVNTNLTPAFTAGSSTSAIDMTQHSHSVVNTNLTPAFNADSSTSAVADMTQPGQSFIGTPVTTVITGSTSAVEMNQPIPSVTSATVTQAIIRPTLSGMSSYNDVLRMSSVPDPYAGLPAPFRLFLARVMAQTIASTTGHNIDPTIPNMSLAKGGVTLTEFEYFPRLPPEIRIRIWKYGYIFERKDKVVELVRKPKRAVLLQCIAPISTILHVNSESRAETKKLIHKFCMTIRSVKIMGFSFDNELEHLRLPCTQVANQALFHHLHPDLNDLPSALNGHFSGTLKPLNMVKRVVLGPQVQATWSRRHAVHMGICLTQFPMLELLTVEANKPVLRRGEFSHYQRVYLQEVRQRASSGDTRPLADVDIVVGMVTMRLSRLTKEERLAAGEKAPLIPAYIGNVYD